MREGVCKHYRGPVAHKDCKTGVVFNDLVSMGAYGWITKLPCFTTHDTDVECEKREFPTAEEIKEHNEWLQEMSILGDEAYRRCAEHAQSIGFKRGEKGVSGEVECPKCNGKLRYSIAASNGHIWAQCTTKDCLRWIQ